MDDLKLIETSLEIAAERCPDLTAPVFDVFFKKVPEAPGLFGKNIEVAMGRMLTEIIGLITEQAAGAGYIEHTVKTSASDHSFWGVRMEMYDAIFGALLDTLRTFVGPEWTDETESAWQRQIDAIMRHTRDALLPHPVLH